MAIVDTISSMYENVSEVYDTITNVDINNGKNLFKGTLNNGIINQGGTYISNPNRITNADSSTMKTFILKKGTYTLSIENIDACTIVIKNESGSVIQEFADSWKTLPYTFTTTNDGYFYFSAKKNIDSALTPSDYKPMLEKGSTATEYQPYTDNPTYKNIENIPKVIRNSYLEIMNNGIDKIWNNWDKVTGEGTTLTLNNTEEAPMKINLKGNTSQAGTPTPDSPIPIQVVSGDNSINVVGKNLFKPTLQNNGTNIILNNISTYSISNGEFSFTASGTDMYFGNVKNAGSEYSDERGIKIFRYDNDYISFNLSNTLLNRTYITAYDSNNISLGFTNINSNRGTYQFPSGCDYITFRFGKADAISGTTYKTTIMVAYGNTIPTYEPYQGNTYPVNLPVENLFELPATQTINGITFTNNGNGTFNLSGTASAITDFAISKELSTIANGNYTMSSKSTGYSLMLAFYNGNAWLSTPINKLTTGLIKTGNITIPSNATRYDLVIRVPSGSTINLINETVQFEKGSKANSYTPYGTTPIELCKIGNYQDTIVKDNGKWYAKKKVGKFYSNSTTDWGYDNNHRYYRVIDNIVVPPNNDTVGQGFCNVRLVTANQTLPNSTTTGLAIHPLSILYISEVVYNNIPTTPIVLYYAYITPTYTEITDSTLISQLNALARSYTSQTNISQESNDLPFIINATALKEME